MLKTLRHLFTPHRSNNHRPKLLQSTGIAVLVGILLVTNSTIELLKAAPPSGLVLGYASNITADQVLIQTNEERAQIGLPPLELNDKLNQAALAKASDMFNKDYWAHTSPDGLTPWVFIKGTGYRYSVAGENLARDFDNTASMVTAWMNSPTHQANIIHPKYTQTGIAVVDGNLDGVETTLVVHMFGTPAGISTISEKQTPPQIASGEIAAETTPQSTLNSLNSAYPQTVLSQAQTVTQPQHYISPLRLKQSIAVAMTALLISILIIDEIIIRKKKAIRFVGHNWVHLGFLSVILLIVSTLSQGGIL